MKRDFDLLFWGVGQVYEVIRITNNACKKRTKVKKTQFLRVKCDVNHIVLRLVCYSFVRLITINFDSDLTECDQPQTG